MRSYFQITLLSLLISPWLCADSFEMKDGTKIEGKLVRETDTEYVVEIQVTKSIKDERTLKKEDVVSMIKSREDLELFKKIVVMTPTPDVMPVSEYQKRIRFIVTYLRDFPDSPKAKEARNVLVTLRTELNQVKEGAIKIGGVMVTSEMRNDNAYDVDATVEALHIKSLMEDKKYLAALRAFDQFEEDYKLSSAYREILPVVRKLLLTYGQSVYQLQTTYDQRVEQRNEGLNQMGNDSRRDSERAIQEQTNALKKLYDDERAAKQKWVSVHPFGKQAIDYTISLVRAEAKRLDDVDSKPKTDGGKLYREYKMRFENEADEKERAKLVKDLQRSGLPERYFKLLQSFKPAVKEAPEPLEEPAESNKKKD